MGLKKLSIPLVIIVFSLLFVYYYSAHGSYNFNSPTNPSYPPTNPSYPPPVVPPPDYGYRIIVIAEKDYPLKAYPPLNVISAYSQTSIRFNSTEKTPTFSLTLYLIPHPELKRPVKIWIKKVILSSSPFPFGWNGTHYVFEDEYEKACKYRVAPTFPYEVFFDKRELIISPNKNETIKFTFKIYEGFNDTEYKNHPFNKYTKENNFGSYYFVIIFDNEYYVETDSYFRTDGSWKIVPQFVIGFTLGGYKNPDENIKIPEEIRVQMDYCREKILTGLPLNTTSMLIIKNK